MIVLETLSNHYNMLLLFFQIGSDISILMSPLLSMFMTEQVR